MAVDLKLFKVGTDKAFKVGGSVAGFKFTPKSLSGLKLWLNNDPDTMTLSGSNKVSQWDDSSGLGNHFTQAVGVNQPEYIPNVVGSLGGVFWQDRTSQRLISTFSSSIGRSNSIFMVWQQIPTNNVPFFIYDGQPSGTNRNNFLFSSGNLRVNSGISNAVKSLAVNPIPLVVSEIKNSSTSTASQYYENGVQIGSNFNNGSNIIQGFTLGNAFVVQSPEQSLNGYIHEFIVVSGDLTTLERTTLNNYLITKYGL